MILIRSGKSGGNLTLSVGTAGQLLYPSNTNTSTGPSSIVLPNISASQWCYVATNRWTQMDTSLAPLVDTDAGTTALEIGSKVVNGNIVIGAALGQGDISIGTNQSSGGTVTIGSNSSATELKGSISLNGNVSAVGNVSIGSNKTVFTTAGQQLRLGYTTTQTTGSVTSSYGPFIKSFGPALSNALDYDILYEGDNGLFPTGSDGCGGLLTIFLKNNITQSKFATYVYTIAKRANITTFTGMQAISINAQGWTSTPGISGNGNNIRVTFNGGDYINTTVAWTFIGSI
jgi:hypothetical protein